MLPQLKNSKPGLTIIGNLSATVEREPQLSTSIAAWHKANLASCHSSQRAKEPLVDAWNIVWKDAETYQLQGAEASETSNTLINVQDVTRVQKFLQVQRAKDLPAAKDAKALARYVLAARADQPHLMFGRPGTLIWLTRNDTPFRKYLLPGVERNASTVRQLLNYLGVPDSAPGILVTQFRIPISRLQSLGLNPRRPTVFDGIDGPFFKQPNTSQASESNWGRTADINSVHLPPGANIDGAPEIVVRPIPITLVSECSSFCAIPAANSSALESYLPHLLHQLSPPNTDWECATAALKQKLDQIVQI